MKRLWLLLVFGLAASGCASTATTGPAKPALDQGQLAAALQQTFDQSETCVTFPAGVSFRPRGRMVEDFIQVRRRGEHGDPEMLLQPLVDAGLIGIAEHPEQKRARNELFVRFTPLGLSAFSRSCRNPNRRYGAFPITIGFRALDIEVEGIASLSEPARIGCVWHTYGNARAKVVDIAPWYDHEALGKYLNRRIDPSANNGQFEQRVSFHSLGGVSWRLGGFDYVHSNLVCLDDD
ncbi:hypothetical protein [Parerythrobacter aestuarii]|uniref:hypothetical protein n=1 Tax=Parerythrobacter aestuarii TaxID=3020909 RepID=UPI0024DED71E|nr:hypothetical protein [Parerythrobacter aestuarii]